MTASMTAFARADHENGRLIWEVRSVNHRYLDIHLKLPDTLKALETACREQIKRYLSRGRIDAQLRLNRGLMGDYEEMLDEDVVSAMARIRGKIQRHIPDLAPPGLIEVLQWPGVVREPVHLDTRLHQQSLDLLNTALVSLVGHRRREGQQLGQLVSRRVAACRALLEGLWREIDTVAAQLEQQWRDRANELCRELDAARLHQEIALLIAKSDVHEELDRVQTHLDQVAQVLTDRKPVGRRLDFLMQELHREVNTLGAKSIDQKMTRATVELKVLIDQMREQVQNIE